MHQLFLDVDNGDGGDELGRVRMLLDIRDGDASSEDLGRCTEDRDSGDEIGTCVRLPIAACQ